MERRSPWRLAGLGVGVGLFAWVLIQADLAAVLRMLGGLRWGFALVLLLYGGIFALDTLGWRFALRPQMQTRVPWLRLFRARLAGEAVNYVTPSASIGGEPLKALLLSRRHGVPLSDGVASVVVAKTTFTVSMLLFVALGLAVALATQELPSAVLRPVWFVLPVLTVLMALFLAAQFLSLFGRGAWLVSRLRPRWFEGMAERLRDWDRAVVSFYRQAPASVLWSLGCHFLGWLAGAAEVYLILHLLKVPISWATALSVEALFVLLRSGAFLIPATLGASEGFLLLICGGLGIGTVAGLALGLTRRARELAWMGLGLLEFAREA